jgi:NADH-quinone oxidoreductase subunit N
MTLQDLMGLLPVLTLAFGSILVLLLGLWWRQRQALLFIGVAVAAAAAFTAVLVSPSAAEVGGMFSTGGYARFFDVIWSLVVALTLLLSWRYSDTRGFSGGEYVSLVLFAGAGMALLSAATSLVGLFVGLEAFTLVLYILIAFDKKSGIGAEGGLKYLVLGVVTTSSLAFGIALIFASAGTFHLPEAMAGLASGTGLRPLGLIGWAMLVLTAGFKVSLVPFHFWTPDVYQGAPAPVAGLLSAGSKGAVFAVLVTLSAGMSIHWQDLSLLLWWIAAVTMLVGTLSALFQENIKRLLAYSSVVHMGYVLVGLLAGSTVGQQAVLFYLVFYAVASLAAFGVITSFTDSLGEPMLLSDYRGAGYRYPFRATVLTISLLALAGIPPTGGFIAKLNVFGAAIRSNYLGLAVLAILASLISLYYYLRIIIALFMAEGPGRKFPTTGPAEALALGLCLVLILALGVFPGPLLDLIGRILG